ncbi:MAG: Ig-like domain-containing protein, partial [Lachnospiraceae bacterium]|nr:Ig-like domain-containing protein [Lachnospiraceae bacterium]
KTTPTGKKKKTSESGNSKKRTNTASRKKAASVKDGEKPAAKKPARRKGADKTEGPQEVKDIPAKTGKAKKTGPSEFRKKSADWKDKKTIEKTAKTVSFTERKKQLAERIKKVTPIQWGIAAMGVIIFITGIMTTAAYANYQGEENKALALKSLGRYTEDESYSAVAQEVTEEMIPEASQEPEPEQARALSLEMSSVEKDLKIKLVDDEDSLVKDVSWSVTVSEDKGDDSVSDDGEVYEDDDMDGTIYIENIAAGDYSVTLNPSDSLADYILPKEKQLVSVKASIEYKVIANIKDEIKSEKEVNVALEDPNGNQAADVEVAAPANTDTVEWFESTKEANGDEYVEATPDLSKTAASAKKDTGFLAALRQLGAGTKYTGIRKTTLGFTLPAGYLVATGEGQDTTSIVNSEVSDNNQENIQENTNPNNTNQNNNTDITVTEPEQNIVTDDVVVEPTSAPSQPAEEASLSISGSSTVAVGSSVNITATYKPDNSTVTWSVSDSSIASLTDNGSTCQVTGVKAGEVTLTISCSNGKETTMKITVTEKEAQYSDDAKLYDASKNALYVKDGDEYRLATYGDYRSGKYSTYYRKQESFLYTGWQDIDGHTYYYLGDHTYVTGEQIIQGIKYNFGSDGTLSKGSGTLGIDVSKYQPSINWASVKASGVSYVIIRCGYRGASTGVLIQDPYFTSHIKGAKAAGLKVGVYFFTTALNETEAVEEASMCAALCSGYGINYPIFMDCESSSRPGYNELSSSERTAIIKAFCNTIKSAGYTPGVYANKTWLSSKMNTSSLSGAKIWLAQYNPAGPTYSGRYDLWQYTSKGHVDGISGNVDMNQSYLGY